MTDAYECRLWFERCRNYYLFLYISEPVFLNVYGARNRFLGMNSASLCSLAGRYDNPIHTRFLAPIDCLKFSALFAAGMQKI